MKKQMRKQATAKSPQQVMKRTAPLAAASGRPGGAVDFGHRPNLVLVPVDDVHPVVHASQELLATACRRRGGGAGGARGPRRLVLRR